MANIVNITEIAPLFTSHETLEHTDQQLKPQKHTKPQLESPNAYYRALRFFPKKDITREYCLIRLSRQNEEAGQQQQRQQHYESPANGAKENREDAAYLLD